MRPPGAKRDLVGEVARVAADRLRLLDREPAVVEERRVQRLGQHAEQVDRLPGRDRGQHEERVLLVAAEDVARHVLGRRHVLERRVGEDLARRLGLRDLVEQAVLELGVDLEGVAEADLPVLEARVLRERAR